MSIIYTISTCAVCGKEGHGHHFGVFSCRACAMFYRRSEYRKEEYVCRKNLENFGSCDLSKTYSCKHCRLKKCEKVGMRQERNKSPPSELELVITLPTVPLKKKKIKREERVSYPIIHPITRKRSEWINIDPLISRSRKILEQFHPPPTTQNALQKMTFSMQKLRSKQNFEPKFEKFLNFDDYFSHWEEMMTRCAEWLMHSEQFQGLPEHERISFFKIVWAVWRRVERHSMSVTVFGKQCIDEKLLLISDDVATKITYFSVDFTNFEMDIMQGDGFEAFRNSVRKNFIHFFDVVSRPTLEWEFTEMEINFALSQIIWMYASRKLLGQTLQAADSFLAEISENLHEYYRNERKIKNYAPRLAVLMEMVNNVLKIQSEHEKVMEMVLMFDSFGCIFSDPKFFCV